MANIEQVTDLVNSLIKNSANIEDENKILENESLKIEKEINEKKEKKDKLDSLLKEYNEMKNNIESSSINYQNKILEVEKLKEKIKNSSVLEKKLEEKINEFNEFKKNNQPDKNEELEKELDKWKKEKKKLMDKIKNYEKQIRNVSEELAIQKNTNKNNDQRFYEYKLEYEKEKVNLLKKISELEEKNKVKENDINLLNKEIEQINEKKINNDNIISSLKNQINNFENDINNVKNDSLKKIKKLEEQILKKEEKILSEEEIKNLLIENSDLLYIKDSSLTYQDLFNNILIDFSHLSKSIFINIDKSFNNTNTLNIFQEYLKDIYFLLFIKYYENLEDINKEKKLNSSDFTDNVILNVSNEIFKYNIFKSNIKNEMLLEIYKNKNISLEEKVKSEIQEIIKKKFEINQLLIYNNIKNVVKKCSDSIKEGNIVIDGKILYNFNPNYIKVCSISNSYLIINNKFLNPISIECIINKIKYPNEPFNKIQFNGPFSRISENYIQKILLNICTFSPDIIYFSIKNCDNLSKQILSSFAFIFCNLSNLKILDLENNKLNNEQIKIISNGIKDNKTLSTLILNNNKISSEGGLYLSEILLENKNISQLYLSKNNIRDKGLKSILNIINNNKTISILDLSYNELEPEDFLNISEFLKENPNMNTLNLNGNELNMKSAINLGKYFSNSNNIKKLYMCDMNISSEISPFLFKNLHSEELYFDNNCIQEIGCILLFKSIFNNGNLRKLSLKNTEINSIGLIHILNALKELKNIEEIHLENNTFNENDYNVIIEFCRGKNYKVYISKNKLNNISIDTKFKDINNIILE